MSFVGRMSYMQRAFVKPQTFMKNVNSNAFKSQFKRSFHMNSKRPRISNNSNKWNVYDELKLYSYASHLAFFMLLPPIIQMYTTKVEVIRDDTLTESSFATVQSDHGIVIKNLNFLDILQNERHKLLDLYLQNEPQGKSQQQQQPKEHVYETINNNCNPNKVSQPSPKKPDYDDEFQIYLLQLDTAYNSLKRNSISSMEYYSNIEQIADRLVNKTNLKHASSELVHNTIMKIFDQLHNLRLHKYEDSLFRRLLTSHKQPEIKFLNIKQRIISNYEFTKSKRSKGKRQFTVQNTQLEIVPTHKIMKPSIWLNDYIGNFERFAQLVQMFAVTNQSMKSFQILFNLGFRNSDIRNQMKDAQLRYGLISALKGLNKKKEALALETRIKKLVN